MNATKLEVLRREALFDISEHVHGGDEKSILQRGLYWAEELTGSKISFLHFVNDDQETIELVTWSEQTLKSYCHVEELETHYPISEAGVWAHAFHTRAPVVVNDYKALIHKKGLPEGHAHLGRFISLPILEGDQVRVLLGVGNKEIPYKDEDIDTVQVIADYLWRIVSRYRIQQRLEEEVRAREELQNILDRSPAVAFLWRTEAGWPVEYVSKNVAEWGYSKEDFETGNLLYVDIIDERDQINVRTEVAKYMMGEANSFVQEYRIVRPDGSVRWIDERSWLRKDETGKATHFEGVCLDITDRKEAERQLWQAQKSEALGNLAGGIAHDFNNMLVPIIALAELTQMQYGKEDERIDKRMQKIVEAGGNAQFLVSRLMDFSRAEDVRYAPLNLMEVLDRTLALLRDTMPATMEIECPPHEGEVWVNGSQSQLQSVFINIAKNAADAIGGKVGFFRVFVSYLRGNELPDTMREQVIAHQPYVELVFKDSGHGMDDALMKRIFDPFFTTKAVGEGTGMGLAMVFGIIQSHNGFITVNSQPGKGATFKVILPILEQDIKS